MGNCITLNTTDCDTAQEAIDDESFEFSREVLARPGDRPSLLWTAMFRTSDWTQVRASDGQCTHVPFVAVRLAIDNLINAAPALERFFAGHGNVSESIQDLIERVEYQKHKHIYIWTLGGDWRHSKDYPLVKKLEALYLDRIEPNIGEVVSFFELHLRKSFLFKRRLVPPSKAFGHVEDDSGYKHDEIDHWNTTAFTGSSDGGYPEDRAELEKFGW